jgi:hypothetical protein
MERKQAQLFCSRAGNANALIDAERVVGWLEFDRGANADGVGTNLGLEVQSVGITRHGVAQPPEVGRLGVSAGRMPQLGRTIEASSAERNPDRPYEGVRRAEDREVDVAGDEEVLVVDDALIRGEQAPRASLLFGDCVVVRRRLEVEASRKLVVVLTAAAAS